MKLLLELDEKIGQIDYIKECTKKLSGTLEICGGAYAFAKDEYIAKQSIKGTMIILQEYCEFLCKNISELQDDMKALFVDVQEMTKKGGILCRK